MGGLFTILIGVYLGPANFLHYGLWIVEQKLFLEKIQFSAFAPKKTEVSQQNRN